MKRAFSSNFLLFFVFLFVALLMAVAIDRLFVSPIPEPLIYSPNSEAHYHTCEFDFSAKINSVGIRDQEVYPKKQNEIRILAIGDSYTYGWGVGNDSTWVKLSEAYLRDKGYQISIWNVGQGGTFSKDYAEMARKAIPVLQPDIVLVSFLQANDLWSAAMHQKKLEVGKIEKITIRQIAVSILEAILPNMYSHSKYHKKNFLIQENWKEEADKLRSAFTDAENHRFDSLPKEVKQCFEDGMLSPSVIYTSIKEPNCYSALEDTNTLFVQKGKLQIREDLMALKKTCEQYKCKMALLFIPDRAYVSREDNYILKEELMLEVDTTMLHSKKVSGLYKVIANAISLPFLHCDRLFEQNSDSLTIFYPYDGHLTWEGNRLLSEQVSLFIEEMFKLKGFIMNELLSLNVYKKHKSISPE